MSAESRIALRICGREPTAGERSIEKILRFFAIDSRAIEPERLESTGRDSMSAPYSILISAARLTAVLKTVSFPDLPPLVEQADSLFVYDFDASEASRQLLERLTGVSSTDVDVRRASSRRVAVTTSIPDRCGALSGVAAECSAVDDLRVFLGVRQCQGFRSVMSTGEGDVFFECRHRNIPIHVSASGAFVDIDQPVDGSFFDVRKCFSSVVPLLIFLRGAFPGAFCSSGDVSASLIVDDPVLKRRYGFLDFSDVLASMNRHNFCTTIALIPWNWRRTNPQTAKIFLNNPDRYSLVVHGCDHTSHEFGTSSLTALNHKVKAALKRVARHLQRTNVRVSPIMVFPQGVFSPEAAYALKCNNFIAAVNTEVNPSGDASPSTLVRELWDMAITQYSSFPIFTRRYMNHGLENVAFDAFLGKPCLLVAHHEVFKDQGRELASFVDSLNSLAGGVKWSTLETAIRRSYSSRSGVDSARTVKMFANEMVLEDLLEHAQPIQIEKRESDAAAIQRVMCNEQEIDWIWRDGAVRFRVEPRLKRAAIKVEYVDQLGDSRSTEGTRYKIRVGVRRYLSEVRDDYVCRSELLNAYAGRVMRLLR